MRMRWISRFGVRFAADFADIFEVRGVTRERRGERLDDIVEHDAVILSYQRSGRCQCAGCTLPALRPPSASQLPKFSLTPSRTQLPSHI